MRLTITAFMALTLIALPAHAATRAIPVPGFSKLRVEGPFTVRVHTGQAASLRASGPQERLDRLKVESRDGTLLITTERGWSWRGMSWGKTEQIVIEIGVPMLDSAELTGSGDLAVDRVRTDRFTALLIGSGHLSVGRLDTVRLKATLAGSGDIALTGATGLADLSVTGSGDLLAPALTADMLNAAVMGSGDLRVGPTKTAKARMMGSGDISIAGHPRCTTSKMGSGDIKCGG